MHRVRRDGADRVYGAISKREAFATLERVRELGINHIDTAEVYGEGENERMVGRAIAGYRDEVLLATKFNYRQYVGETDRSWAEVVRARSRGVWSASGLTTSTCGTCTACRWIVPSKRPGDRWPRPSGMAWCGIWNL